MTASRTETIFRVAGMVADGVEIDWIAERVSSSELIAELAELATVEKIRNMNGATPAALGHEESPSQARIDATLSHWGKLEIRELLGEGSFGEVYRAHDPDLEREVALKLRKGVAKDDEGTERFLSEARRLARVRHPNVIVIHGVEVHDGRAGFWTEYVRGVTLETLLHQRGTWDAREASIVGIELCRALAAVHAAGLIHRDVKTTNVMREQGAGRILLMDFGSGGNLPAGSDVSETGHIHGTPLAMAPEQLRGMVAGPATDIYGLGVLLYRLFTNEFPVVGNSIPDLVEEHSRNRTRRLRDLRADLPTEFVQIVERALEKNPAARFQSAGEMELALARALRPDPVPAPRFSRSLTWGRFVLGFAVPALVIAVGFWATRAMLPSRRGHDLVSAPLSATASLYRHTTAGDDRIFPGAKIAIGDRLFLKLRASDSTFVYVIDEDQGGTVFVLFPNPRFSPRNPLAPGSEYRIPDRMSGSVADWRVTSAGGREVITILALRKPLPEIDRAIRALPLASVDQPIQYPEVKPDAFRGIGGIATEPSPEGANIPHSVSQALQKVAGRQRGVDEPWIWQQEIDNPSSARP